MPERFFTIEHEVRGTLVQYDNPPLRRFKSYFQKLETAGRAWRFGTFPQAARIAARILKFEPENREGLMITSASGKNVWSYPDSLVDDKLIVSENVTMSYKLWIVIEHDEDMDEYKAFVANSEEDGNEIIKKQIKTHGSSSAFFKYASVEMEFPS